LKIPTKQSKHRDFTDPNFDLLIPVPHRKSSEPKLVSHRLQNGPATAGIENLELEIELTKSLNISGAAAVSEPYSGMVRSAAFVLNSLGFA
jgi:hypothetical protein